MMFNIRNVGKHSVVVHTVNADENALSILRSCSKRYASNGKNTQYKFLFTSLANATLALIAVEHFKTETH